MILAAVVRLFVRLLLILVFGINCYTSLYIVLAPLSPHKQIRMCLGTRIERPAWTAHAPAVDKATTFVAQVWTCDIDFLISLVSSDIRL
jgi:hypothetical protein